MMELQSEHSEQQAGGDEHRLAEGNELFQKSVKAEGLGKKSDKNKKQNQISDFIWQLKEPSNL